jgi:hypothetical protein
VTYGQLKLRLTQAFPGISLDLIEGWCNDRYQEILGELPWFRENIQAALLTSVPYTTGTVAVTQGSDAVTLTGGTWDSSMNGLAFRVKGENDYYEFQATSLTSGTLDRPYDGPSSSATAYSISQEVYVLPADCQLLADDAFTSRLGPMRRFTHEQINAFDPTHSMSGVPTAWASYMDDDSTPPRIQAEFWPTPTDVETLYLTYNSHAGDLQGEATILQVWMQSAALYDGIVGRIQLHLKNPAVAQVHLALAEKALKSMRGSEAQGLALGEMQLSQYYTGYRSRKYSR